MTFSGVQPITARDLAVAEIAHLEQDERAALILGQPREVGHQLAQVGAAHDVVGQAVEGGLEIVDGDGGVAPRRQQRAAAVTGDREQPWPHGVGHAAGAERAVRAQEGLLKGVLAVLAVADHVAAEGEQRRVVAVVERLEGARVAARHERRQALVVKSTESVPGEVQRTGDAAGWARIPCDQHSRPPPGLLRHTPRDPGKGHPMSTRTLVLAAMAVTALLAVPQSASADPACDTQGAAGTAY